MGLIREAGVVLKQDKKIHEKKKMNIVEVIDLRPSAVIPLSTD